ncbi:MAG TPA: flagellar basal body L-ring protein FlgH [Planctomycetaceae bacterium]|jgi:flagellar L-ring protein precursor FlgH|nr:flagellar basal body L-ring protein FlgH [Planctomycetaceae bacterium]
MRSWLLAPVLIMTLWQTARGADQPDGPYGLGPGVPPGPRMGPPTGPSVYDGRSDFFTPHPPLLVRDFGWSFVETPKPHEVKVHDIITVTVKEAAQTQATSTYNRQRNGQYTAQLAQFIRVNSQGNLDNAALNSPEIDGELQSRLQSTGQVTEAESMKYRIAATVVDILPNGVLVLEAHKSIVDNKDLWEYTLTGKVDPKKISPDDSVLSENVADLSIAKVQHGKLTDSTKRAWFVHLYDWIGPF